MTFRPIFDKILVEPETRIKSEILEVVMDEVDNKGTIVAVGPGKMDDWGRFTPNPCKVGMKIRFGTMGRESKDEYLKYFPYYENGKRYLVMSWQDVCFIEE